MPPKEKKQQQKPVALLLRDGNTVSALANVCNRDNGIEVVPKAPIIIGVNTGQHITVRFGGTERAESAASQDHKAIISLASGLKGSRIGKMGARGKFQVAECMKPFWEKQGWVERKDGEIVRYLQADWSDQGVRTSAVRFLINNVLKIDPRIADTKSFTKNSLSGLFQAKFDNSVYRAIAESFPELNIMPWELSRAPQGLFAVRENRIAAVRWLAEKTEKDPRNLSQVDFYRNHMEALLKTMRGIYRAVSEAYPELKILPWQMAEVTHGYYNKRANRVTAIRWLVETKLKIDPRELTKRHLQEAGLGGLKEGVHSAVTGAYPKLQIKRWEMAGGVGNDFWTIENSTALVAWLEKKTGKGPLELSLADAIPYYSTMSGEELCTAIKRLHPKLGDIRIWQLNLSMAPGFWGKKVNRVAATRWLAAELRKDPKKLSQTDFKKHGMSGLIRYANYSQYRLVNEAYPELHVMPWEMGRILGSFWAKDKNVADAGMWLARKLGKTPAELTQGDLEANGLGRLANDVGSGRIATAVKRYYPGIR